MANIKSSKKRILVNRKKAAENKEQNSEMKTFINKFKKNPTAESYSHVVSLIDEAARDGIIHKNKADRFKSKLAKLVPAA